VVIVDSRDSGEWESMLAYLSECSECVPCLCVCVCTCISDYVFIWSRFQIVIAGTENDEKCCNFIHLANNHLYEVAQEQLRILLTDFSPLLV
jgi:hypothetical protein